MIRSTLTRLSLVAAATAIPNAMPEPEPNQLEARTFSWIWNPKDCNCKCEEGNKGWKRSEELETRTLSWLFPKLGKDQCQKECKKKCDDVSNRIQFSICLYTTRLLLILVPL